MIFLFILSIEDNEKDLFLNVLHKLNVDCIIGMTHESQILI